MGPTIERIKSRGRGWLCTHPVLQGAYHGKFRWITGPFRMLPDFIIIGAQKCGTTSLYDYITKHPTIRAAQRKEIHYFAFNDGFVKIKFGPNYPVGKQEKFGVNWYRSNFPTKFEAWAHYRRTNQEMLTGEASTQYMPYPETPERVKRLIPSVKLLAILRNPTDRAYSAYNFHRLHYMENRTFEDAVKQELDGYETRYIRRYLVYGHYAQHLERWFECFDRSQILVLATEELREDQQGTLDKIWEFLGVMPHQFEQPPKNLNVGNYEPMSEKMRKCLIEYYLAHNEKLAKLLGRCFDWDR